MPSNRGFPERELRGYKPNPSGIGPNRPETQPSQQSARRPPCRFRQSRNAGSLRPPARSPPHRMRRTSRRARSCAKRCSCSTRAYPHGCIRTRRLHEFAVEPAIARIADVFEEHAPQVRADLAYTSFVQCGYQFVCHRQTTPQISPACRRCEHLLHIKYVTVHILNYLPHSATPCRLQRVSLYFNIFQNVFQSRLHVFHTYRYIFHSVYRYR